jgi:cardiolipin synthase
MTLGKFLMGILHPVLIVLAILVVVASITHALLSKRDPKGALGWIAVSLLFPFVGPLLYFFFGINRVQTRARKLQRISPFQNSFDHRQLPYSKFILSSRKIPSEYRELARISDTVTKRPLVGCNRIEILHNGEEAYPAMIEAIEGSKRSVSFTTYIFETDNTGRKFIEALGRAMDRGVDVRVIIDGVGEIRSFHRASTLLKKRNVRVARFLPPGLFPPALHINLRNHRKIMVVDGQTGFTGGMNIGDHHLAENTENPSRVIDTHFRLTGPVVTQMEHTFKQDWRFITGEQIVQQINPLIEGGTSICRAIAEGPDEDMDTLSMILLGAVSSARQSICIMTPYFIPPRGLLAALQAAALRGVDVTIILPSKNDLYFVHWATRNLLWELLQRDIHVYYQPSPFVHTKLVLIDNHYSQIGSANIDPRSLRLNFEFNVEIYDKTFGATIAAHFDTIKEKSRGISLKEVDDRKFLIRIRDSLAWLLSPYL